MSDKNECIFEGGFNLDDNEVKKVEELATDEPDSILPYSYRLVEGRYPVDCVYENIDGARISFESLKGQALVAKALSYIPAEIVASMIDKVGIVFAESKGVAGCALPRIFTDGKQMLHINLCLLHYDPTMKIRGIPKVTDIEHKAIYLIAHEVAHFHLGHTDKLYGSHENTRELSEQFERQAERLACKWLKNRPLYNRKTW